MFQGRNSGDGCLELVWRSLEVAGGFRRFPEVSGGVSEEGCLETGLNSRCGVWGVGSPLGGPGASG